MSDNTTINPGAGGDVVADDELDVVNGATQQTPKPRAQRVKTGFGPDGSIRDVDATDPAHGLPVQALPGAQQDGHSVTLGATSDDAAALTVVGRLKAIVGLLSGTLQVADSAGLSKLEAIRSLLAGTLTVTDSTAEAKLEAIRALLAGTVNVDLPAGPLAVSDVTAEGKLEDVRVLLAGTLAVSDATAETKLEAVRALLAGTITVDGSAHTQPISAASLPLPAGAATDANLTSAVGAAGNSPPSLATSASGLIGWLRKIVDSLAGTLTTSVSNFPASQPVTSTDGAQATVGTTTDASSALTLVGLLKAVKAAVQGTLTVGGTVTANAGTGTLAVSQANPADQASTLTSGRKTVTTAGTALALRATLACKWVSVSALDTNTQLVYVGGSATLAAAGSQAGIPLLPGASVTVPVDDAEKVYVDSRVNGEGVSFLVGS